MWVGKQSQERSQSAGQADNVPEPWAQKQVQLGVYTYEACPSNQDVNSVQEPDLVWVGAREGVCCCSKTEQS